MVFYSNRHQQQQQTAWSTALQPPESLLCIKVGITDLHSYMQASLVHEQLYTAKLWSFVLHVLRADNRVMSSGLSGSTLT